MARIGDLYESRCEVTIEWKINEFSLISQETDIRYNSPKFYFSGTSWDILLYPNGQTGENNDGWLGLYLVRRSGGSRVTVNYTFSLKTASGKHDFCVDNTDVFKDKSSGWGIINFLRRSTVMERKSELLPSDALIIVCTLKNHESKCTDGSLFNRLQKISDNLKDIYEDKNRIDCVLSADSQRFPAHRMILETQSPVFAAMFNTEMKENQSGEIFIDDIDKDIVDIMVRYMYTGDIDKLTTENALFLYDAAEKYDIQDIKDICKKFITENLSLNWLFDVINFGELYEDDEICSCATNYFKENVQKNQKMKKWRKIAKENNDICTESSDYVFTAFVEE